MLKGTRIKEDGGQPTAVGVHGSLVGKTRGQSHLSPPPCLQQGQCQEYKQGHVCVLLFPLCVTVFVYIILLVSAKGLLIILS